MIICKTEQELDLARLSVPAGPKIALVPTMGALHAGHIALVKKALEYTPYVFVSIFVNPTQFNNKEDYKRYPRTLEEDCRLLENSGAFAVFAPTAETVYPNGEDKRIFDLGGLDKTGEGPRRPGHFNGVAQIVSRLFDLVKPSFAFFGEKDFQQLAIICYFTGELNYPVKIIACPIIREESGLAMSSRNSLLTPAQKAVAPRIYQTLREAREMVHAGAVTPKELSDYVAAKINEEPMLETEYVEIVDADTLRIISDWKEAQNVQLCTAVYAHPIRLIDNIKLK